MLARMRFAFMTLLVACAPPGGDADTDADAEPADAEPMEPDAAPDSTVPDATESPPPRTWAPQPWEDCEGAGRTLEAGPDDYRDVLGTLAPGDTLRLRPGDYARGLPLRSEQSGEPGRCVVVEAADPQARPRFLGSDGFNVVAIHGASWIKIRGLDLDGLGLAGFGVASQGGAAMPTHHVLVEDLHMAGFGGGQQVVGVSTKSPAWAWVVRGNVIEGAGTGMYLGNSNGEEPFVGGVVELNVVRDTLGYNIQIKHQNQRPDVAGFPDQAETLVRYNVLGKANGAELGMARPNLLLGHFPPTGPGRDDTYRVYGNLIYANPVENLVQMEGNVDLHDNLLVNPVGGALLVRPHNAAPRAIDIYHNTIIARGVGVRLTGGDPDFAQRVLANVVFSDGGLRVDDAEAAENLEGSYDEAATLLVAPFAAPADLDLHPRAPLEGATTRVPDSVDADLDFDRRPRTAPAPGAYRGPADAASRPLVSWR